MKSIVASAAIMLVLFFPANALASCPNITGPYSCCGTSWYQYELDPSCAGTSGSVSSATMSCYSQAGHQYTGNGTVTYTYTIGQSDPILNSAHWSAQVYVDFNDPNNSIYDTLNLSVSVTHNGSTTSYTMLSQNGTQGSLSCSTAAYWYFTAVAGDTITLTFTATNYYSNTTIKTGTPLIFNQY